MTTAAAASSTGHASALRNLYLVRFGFAIVWAGLLFAVGSSVGPLSVTLIVLYPVFDVAAAIVDARSSGAGGPARLLHVNIAISSLAAIGLVFALTSGIPAVLRVWGAWAVVAGIVQLVVALTRRALGGQWAMILSGGISVLAGISFVPRSGTGSPTAGFSPAKAGREAVVAGRR